MITFKRKNEIRMKLNRKEILLYPAITAAAISGVIAFGDSRRDTLEPFWWYVVAALILFAALSLSRYLIWRKKNKKQS